MRDGLIAIVTRLKPVDGANRPLDDAIMISTAPLDPQFAASPVIYEMDCMTATPAATDSPAPESTDGSLQSLSSRLIKRINMVWPSSFADECPAACGLGWY